MMAARERCVSRCSNSTGLSPFCLRGSAARVSRRERTRTPRILCPKGQPHLEIKIADLIVEKLMLAEIPCERRTGYVLLSGYTSDMKYVNYNEARKRVIFNDQRTPHRR